MSLPPGRPKEGDVPLGEIACSARVNQSARRSAPSENSGVRNTKVLQ